MNLYSYEVHFVDSDPKIVLVAAKNKKSSDKIIYGICKSKDIVQTDVEHILTLKGINIESQRIILSDL